MNWIASVALIALSLLPWQAPSSITKPLEDASLGPDPAAGALAQPSALPTVKIPVRQSNSSLELKAPAAYAIDAATGQTLYSKDADTQRPIASVTKLVTALVILQSHKLSESVTIPRLPAYGPYDELLGLKPGEVFTVRDLLAAALINSANDAADSLAIIDSGSREIFAAKMNSYLAAWGISNAHFSNPTGLIDAGNGASPRALARIALLALKHPEIRQTAGQNGGVITDAAGQSFNLKPTNVLLSGGRFHGIKTGYTLAAGGCFVGLATVNGQEVITVVLGSPDRFGDSLKLTDWIQTNYTWF